MSPSAEFALKVGLLGLTTVQRVGELFLARRNTQRLIAKGAYEVGAAHYPLIVALHTAWIAGLWVIVLWRNPPLNLAWAGIYLGLQALRVWVLTSLGDRWTTRIIILPGQPLVKRGPYRFIPHPNYAVVIAEILVLPLAFGLWIYSVVFTLLNAVILTIRIRTEDAALRALRPIP